MIWPWREVQLLKEQIAILQRSVEYWRGAESRQRAAALAAWKELRQQTKGIRRLRKRLDKYEKKEP